ncbi:MAG: T9SS type A sorting domain-containing protein [Crocinitomicaceae bacterium]
MKRNLLNLTLLAVASIVVSFAQAQRYQTEVFTSTDITSNVSYGENFSILTGAPILQNLVMDVYEPAGDSITDRPLILLMHGGNYLPRYINQLPTGDKSDSAVVELANRFSRMGYVVAVPSYRQGWNPQGTQDERSTTYINAIYRGIQDVKTCIRYFRSDADQSGNTYGINVDRIAVGGYGSGADIALGANSLNELAEIQLTKFFNFTTNAFMIDTALVGDWDGLGGNTALNFENHIGYSSDFDVAFNMGGSIGDSTWIDAGDNPIISVHGVQDAYAPYGLGIIFVPGTTLFITEVSGSSDVIRIQNIFGNNDIFFTPPIVDAYTTQADAMNTTLDGTYGNGGNEGLFPIVGLADGNSPWQFWDDASVNTGAIGLGQDPAVILANGYSANPVYQALGPVAGKARAMAFIDTIQNYVAPRLFRVLVEPYVGLDHLENDLTALTVYPNPGKNAINIRPNSVATINKIEVIDWSGRQSILLDGLNVNEHSLEVTDLNSGIYLIRVTTETEVMTSKWVKE